MLKHPEALRSILVEIIKSGRAAGAGRRLHRARQSPPPVRQSQVTQQRCSIPYQVIVGNPQGDVTMVEFFDYNCGFCKRALSDTLALIKDDPNLKIVLKELRILGPGSLEAAQVAVAVRIRIPAVSNISNFIRGCSAREALPARTMH